ncbi:MAG: hypothetical protein FP820_09795 [Sulfurimonas sp.]|nr:hypothetical protein [Sulfurimonas sp.]MBU1216053.1 hypothetical protein [bacterium]MBU1434359.1 hypothetical protein [bacterium]MBU1501937.1 hypothetical protein [bacterium]MBU3939568.1 hypothetical protein [bacterium]
MKKNITITSLVWGMMIVFGGCSGSGGGTYTSVEATSLSEISGVVSDGPIKNARAFLDINENGAYDIGEPYDITNERGEYTIKYVLDPGKEYLVIAEGSSDLNTSDEVDNAGNSPLIFKMFVSFTASGSMSDVNINGIKYTKNLNPTIFKSYLADLNSSLSGLDANATDFIETTEINSVTLFQTYILDKDMNGTITQLTQKVQESNEAKEQEIINTTTTTPYELSGDLKALLLDGNINEESVGIKSLIDTKFAFYVVQMYGDAVGGKVENNESDRIENIIYLENENTLTAIFKNSYNTQQTINSYTQNEVLAYEGTLIFSNDINNTLLSAKYTQKHFQGNSQSGNNKLDGVVSISDYNGSAYRLDFTKGVFDLHTAEYGNIKGNVTVKNADTESIPTNNANTIELTDANITTALAPIKIDALYSATLVGNWNGTLSDSCEDANGTITISFASEYSASWQAESGVTFYGTDLSVNGTKVTLKDDTRIWSVADINTSQNTISGSWSASSCSGTFSVSQQVDR